jgi:hypothetical protein
MSGCVAVARPAQLLTQGSRCRIVDRKRVPGEYDTAIRACRGDGDKLVSDIAKHHRRVALQRVAPAAGAGDLMAKDVAAVLDRMFNGLVVFRRRVIINWGTTGRLFDDCDSVMPPIGVRRALIRCDKPPRMCADLS